MSNPGNPGNPGHPGSKGIAGVISTFFFFVFYVIIDDIKYFVVPTGESPIIKEEFKKFTVAVSALKALLAREVWFPKESLNHKMFT